MKCMALKELQGKPALKIGDQGRKLRGLAPSELQNFVGIRRAKAGSPYHHQSVSLHRKSVGSIFFVLSVCVSSFILR